MKKLHYAFLNRVPTSCQHDKDCHNVYLLDNPNVVPPAGTLILHGESAWRQMKRIQGSPFDVTTILDEMPDFYYVTRCDRCDAARIREWQEQFWDLNPYERRTRFIRALSVLECQSTLTGAQVDVVLDLVETFHLTRYDFKLLDEQPGQYEDMGRWHWKLRQVRNRANRLFEILTENEAEGYTDENRVPTIPLQRFNKMD